MITIRIKLTQDEAEHAVGNSIERKVIWKANRRTGSEVSKMRCKIGN